MKNFDINRFKSFALYDLTINQKYYRSQAMITILVLMGIALTCFLFRWMICETMTFSGDLMSFTDYRDVTITTTIMAAVISIIIIVLAGCTFHNLITKQGRISELTLPATSLEKFTWHVCLNVLGGIILCLFALLCADALNALLMAMTFPMDGQQSLFLNYIDAASLNKFEEIFGTAFGKNDYITSVATGTVILMITNTIFELSAYVFGNSIKYRYNIIWTFATLQIISLFVVIGGINLGIHTDVNFSTEDVLNLIKYSIYGASVFFAALSILLFWLSYRNYSTAVITSKRNK